MNSKEIKRYCHKLNNCLSPDGTQLFNNRDFFEISAEFLAMRAKLLADSDQAITAPAMLAMLKSISSQIVAGIYGDDAAEQLADF